MIPGTRHTEGIDKRSEKLTASPRSSVDPAAFFTRDDLASHLNLSLRSVDRFVSRHGLRSGPGRAVLVCLETYAWCLVSLRRQSTQSMTPAPPVRRRSASPRPLRPGEELVVLGQSNGFDRGRAARSLGPGCRLRTLDECHEGHWGWSVVRAIKAMASVHEAMESTSRPEPNDESSASRYLRQYLREAQASTLSPLNATVLALSLRRVPADSRRLLLEAVSGEVANAARKDSGVPLVYAREPLLTEEDLARELRRSVATVRRWRVEGTGPVFMKVDRAVRYSRVDVERWLGERPRS